MKKYKTIRPDCQYFNVEIKPWFVQLKSLLYRLPNLDELAITPVSDKYVTHKCYLCNQTKICEYSIDQHMFGSHCGKLAIVAKALLLHLNNIKNRKTANIKDKNALEFIIHDLSKILSK